MKLILCLLAVVLFCTGCSVLKESPDSDSGNKSTADTLDGSSISADSKDSTDKEIILNSIVISKDDTGLMVAAYDKNNSFRQFDPVAVHYTDTSSLEVTMGAIIKISFDGRIAESYPSQIWADKIEVVETVQDNWPATKLIPEDYSSEEAVKDNCYVITNDKIESEDLMDSFMENTKNGMAGYLRRVIYTIEGDPIINDIIYNGNKYFVFEDMTRDAFAGNGEKLYKKEYSYINTFEKNNAKLIYLADRNDITSEEYEKSMTSGNSDDLLDIYPVSY
ncbi:MAG: DUF4362 domain-containing protein [Anaerocolumna sp.]